MEGLQRHLAEQPRDARSWTALGAAYVERARWTGDPTLYPRAEQALARALAIDPQSATATAASGALANARHDFAAAERWARQALQIDRMDAGAYGVLTDALTELGRYDDALAAAKRMDGLRPNLASLARLSYQEELRGRTVPARRLMRLALAAATLPADIAWTHQQLGDLAWSQGDTGAALAHYNAALRADSRATAALVGRARVFAATGSTQAALRLYAKAVADRPLPQFALEYGELLQSLGRIRESKIQYGLLAAQVQLARANGVSVDLELGLFEADHGDPAAAVAATARELSRRRSIHVEDAYAWALHAAGRDAEALPHVRQALRLGTQNPLLYFHKGMIEAALGLDDAARADLSRALELNPNFSPLWAPQARAALEALDGAR